MIEYTIFAADDNPRGNYMWSLNCDPQHKRRFMLGSPEMICDVQPTSSYLHAFSLFKKSHPTVSEAKRKRDPVSIMGKDGDEDLLEALLGYAVYDRREYTETYIMLRDGSDSTNVVPAPSSEWAALASEFASYLNSHIGQWRITSSNDPGFYWLGRVTATYDPEKYRGIVTMTAEVEPYKLEKYHSAEVWLWDDFSFIDGIIREYGDITVPANGTTSLQVPVRVMDMIPEFKSLTPATGTDDVQVSVDNINWCDAAFDDYTQTADQSVLYPKPLTIPGSAVKRTVRTLYFKNNTGTTKHISVKVRGGSL